MTAFKHTARLSLLALSVTAVTACSTIGGWFEEEDKAPLPGERISVLELQKNLEPDNAVLEAQGFSAPQAWRNEYWPQAGGYPNHSMQHLALNTGTLKRAWSADIGQGASEALPLTAQPVIVDGRVYTIDTDSGLSAFNIENGKRLWTIDISNPDEDDPVIGGGMAYSRGKLFVTNGYNEVLALDPSDGSLIWRVTIPSAARAAPTVMGERVFVTTLDNRLLSLNAADGTVLWEYAGLNETAGLVGAASPAASRDIVVPVFSSGEIFALQVENGAIAWGDNLSSFRRSSGLAGLSDIRGLPVIDKNIVIAISFGGQITAIDERTGSRIWQRDIGGSETPWVAGNQVFVISSDNEMVALGRDDGTILWVSPLPRYKKPESKSGPVFWTGPVLAGGRLIAAGTNGDIVEVSPESGEIIQHWKAGSSFSIPPVVATDVLYLLDDNGTLMAYR
ncbi:MAG: PQQ-binding-like beta-propeller repeat protein [Rhodospirillales bacterium]|nr:PQQ-binding-like beta-propeller repeat protein [Rhodospirillales bacterium]